MSDRSHPTRVGGAAIRDARRVTRMVGGLCLAPALLLAACTGGGSAASPASKGSSDSLVVASAGLPTTFVIDGAAPAGYENLEFGVNTQMGLLRQPYKADATSGRE